VKKSFVCSLALTIIDQVIKLLISRYYMTSNIVMLSGILTFQPVQNTNLNWIASITNYKTPVFLMIIIQIIASTVIVLLNRYLTYLWIQGKKLINGMLIFFIAGIMCSFIDVTFWGGSLDFLLLFDWFTFDFKDVYLNIGFAFLLFYYANYYIKSYHKMSKAERKQTGIWIWIKKGMPSMSIK